MSEAASHTHLALKLSPRVIVLGVIAVVALVAAILYRWWLPPVQRLVASRFTAEADEEAKSKEPAGDHGGHAHDHAGHDEGNSLEMSEQARKNIGLRVEAVKTGPYTKSISVPGIVVERPGRSVIKVTALMTGVITRIYPIQGQAVEPGQKLFDLRLTHEELVQSQADLLKTAEELEVNEREINRIERLTQNSAIPRKQMVGLQYERQKLEVVMRSKRQELLLHGLTNEQVDGILQKHELLKDMAVTAPAADEGGMSVPAGAVFQIQSLEVEQGQHVEAGASLAVLVDHAELYIEGEAFERDVALINRAAVEKANVSAVLEAEGGKPEVISKLRILYLDSKVDLDTRTQDFFVTLPNVMERDEMLDGGRRFIAWKYRPGQRVQLQVPIETLENRIVLPIEAVAQDGVEFYVFAPNGNHFDRIPVHVEHRDTRWAVIANDGSIFPGDLVAVNGAQQLQLALKNKAGGGIDPHAGHNH